MSHDWIRVRGETGGFDLSVDTTLPGAFSGSVTFSGPTGTAMVAIDVEVLHQESPASPARDSRALRRFEAESRRPAPQADPWETMPAAEPVLREVGVPRHADVLNPGD